MRRGDQPNVDPSLLHASDPAESLFLDHLEQPGLYVDVHIADFVEEQSPPMRDLEEARLGPCGAGECALLVTEELAFQQFLAESCAVELHQRLVGSLTVLMQPAG